MTDALTEAAVSAAEHVPAELLAVAGKQSPVDLSAWEFADRDPDLGTGVDRAGLIVGLAQHDAYHIGQIAVVRQALGKPPA